MLNICPSIARCNENAYPLALLITIGLEENFATKASFPATNEKKILSVADTCYA